MHLLTSLALLTLPITLVSAQAAAGGGAVATTANTQYPTVTTCESLKTVDGTTTVETVVFTQTFAATALGTWAFGNVVSSGSVGLGSISGTVGAKTKRGLADVMPTALFGSW